MARPKPGSIRQPQRDPRRSTRKPAAVSVAVRRQKSLREFLTIEQLKYWLSKGGGTSYGVSILIHVLALIILSFFVLEGMKKEETQIVTAFSDIQNDVVLEDFVDLEVELPSVSSSDTLQKTLSLSPGDLAPVLGGTGSEGSGSGGGGSGDGIGFKLPAGAVRKGSFAAWTIPKDPEPRQDYLIVIQVILPESVTTYRKEDITGYMRGDDGYQTPIGECRGRKCEKDYYGVFDMERKQFAIKIPGAAAKVKDVIEIRSKILKEEQTLEIIF